MTEEMTRETVEVIVGACEKYPNNNEVGSSCGNIFLICSRVYI